METLGHALGTLDADRISVNSNSTRHPFSLKKGTSPKKHTIFQAVGAVGALGSTHPTVLRSDAR